MHHCAQHLDQSSPPFTAVSVTDTCIIEVYSQSTLYGCDDGSLNKSTWFGLGEFVAGYRNLACALLLQPGAQAQGWVFLEEWTSFSSSIKCYVWDSGSPP